MWVRDIFTPLGAIVYIVNALDVNAKNNLCYMAIGKGSYLHVLSTWLILILNPR